MSANRVILVLGLLSALFFPSAAPAQQAHISSSARNIQLLTPEVGWTFLGNGLFWTTDGGGHWKNISPPAERSKHIASVFFLDTYTGWALIAARNDSSGEPTFELASTTDAGADWSVQPVVIPEHRGTSLGTDGWIDFVDSSHGWVNLEAAGSTNFNPGMMLETEDGGARWTVVQGPQVWGAIRFITAEDGWLAGGPGDEHLYVTHNGSKTWQEVRLKPPAQVGGAIVPAYDLPVFEDDRHGFLQVIYSGPEGVASQLLIYSTADGGKTWEPDTILSVLTGSSVGVPAPTAITDSAAILAVGPSPAGVSVVSVPLTGPGSPGRTISLVGGVQISFANSEDGWVLTQSGLLSTTDGGASWTNVTPWGRRAGPAASVNQPVSAAAVSGVAAPAQSVNPAAGAGGSVHRSVHLGFDMCQATTVAAMQTWWTYSPYYDANIYIGGDTRSCLQPNLSSAWVTQVSGQGWGLIPTWSGPQAPCTTFSNTFSSTPSVAVTQGETEATSAANAAKALGLSQTVIYYDMENYDTTNTQCGDAVTAFVGGWVSQLHNDGYSAGVYANPDPAEYDVSAASPLPDEIWVAKYDGRATIWGLGDLEDPLWSTNQRVHQYLGNTTESYGAVSLTIDRDIENASVAGSNGAKSFSYTLLEFQYPGATGTSVQGINDLGQMNAPDYTGQIVGGYGVGTQSYGFLDVGGSFTSIAYPGGTQTQANALNNLGQVVGIYLDNTNLYHGFLYLANSGTLTTVDDPSTTSSDYAYGINDDSQIVGYYWANSANHGYLDAGGTFTTIDYPGALETFLTAINGLGQMVGGYNDSKGSQHGFLYDGGNFSTFDCKGATVTEPFGINNNGLVVGVCWSSAPQYTGFLYDTVHKTFTTFLYQGQPTYLWGINDAAQMVGYYLPGSTTPSQGLVATH